MKNAQKLSDWQQEEKNKIVLKPCLVCGKVPKYGYYGGHEGGGTCSRECEVVQNKKPKYPGHSEEDFFRRQHATLPESETG